MTARRSHALLLILGLLAVPVLCSDRSVAQTIGRPEVDRQVVVFLVDRVSFEELLAVPDIRALARAGGAGLMSPATAPGDQGPGAYLTLGTGARSAGPELLVRAFDKQEEVGGRLAGEIYVERYPKREVPLGPILLDVQPYLDANEGLAVPGLLTDVLRDARRSVVVFGNADTPAGRDRPGFLMAMGGIGAGVLGRLGIAFLPSPGMRGPPRQFPLAEPTPDELGGFRLDYDVLSFLALGNRLPNPSPFLSAHLTVFDMGDTLRIDRAAGEASHSVVVGARREALARTGEQIRYLVGRAASTRVMVIVVAPAPSSAMDRTKDELTPIVVARGNPLDLFPEQGEIQALTSDTTRRVGVVSNEDVAPTILRFFGLFVRPEMNGAPIELSTEPAPFELHERHLANRRMSVPVQVAAGIYVTAMGLLGIALLAWRERVPARLGRSLSWVPLTVPALGVALLAAGHLPTLSYSTVVPFLVLVTLAGTLAFLPLRRWGVLLPPAAIGAGVLVFFAAEALLDWTAALTPFLGGSELDGARFYGMPNVFVGLLLGSSLYVAARLARTAGFILIAVSALFAGLPGAGANIGGALALFAAGGIWLVLRGRTRPAWQGIALVVAVVLVGTAVVLAAHALNAAPTHGTRLVEDASRSPLGLLETLSDRLLIGWRLIVRNPFALVPVLGVPACMLAVLRPPSPIRPSLEAHPEWRDALLTILLASAVAYVVEDSGAASVGLAFGLALGGLLYVSLSEQAWKAEPAAETAEEPSTERATEPIPEAT